MTYFSVMYYSPKFFRRERINVAVLVWDIDNWETAENRMVIPLPPNGKQRLTNFILESSPAIFGYDDVAELINRQCADFLSAKYLLTWYGEHRKKWQPCEIDIDPPEYSNLSKERLIAFATLAYL